MENIMPMVVAGIFGLLCVMGVIYVKVSDRELLQEKEEGIKTLNSEMQKRAQEIEALEEEIRELNRNKEILDYVKVKYPVIGDLIEKEHLDEGTVVKRDEAYNDYQHALENFKPATEYEAEIQKLKDELYVEKMEGEYLTVFRNIVIRNSDKLADEVVVNSSYNYDKAIKGAPDNPAGFDIDIDILKGDVKKYQHKMEGK
ncbi:hypothetical protein D081_0895 [Anaerovibrio sp. JC8]|uniref:hypothetical protein n=1 Tax=Anaerovibrio sp. JC8 TaxID=1240085 RepID=UPI000A0E0FE8|nr:hypothetical protein [Anaerovibrio sp. JC8]ORU00372.1 hypothetical protein D081_0895 [Anaerovibrio sp. JC8]